MRLGLLHIIACPHCDARYSLRDLYSGNLARAKYYSDGKTLAFMLPDSPVVTLCYGCSRFFWVHEAKDIGTFEWDKMIAYERRRAKPVRFLTADEYFSALQAGIAQTREKETYIRQRLWWALNDSVRDTPEKPADFLSDERWKKNAKALLALLDDKSIENKLMIAELHRNLGDFAECIRVLHSIDDEKLNWMKPQFAEECEKGNKQVFQFREQVLLMKKSPVLKLIEKLKRLMYSGS